MDSVSHLHCIAGNGQQQSTQKLSMTSEKKSPVHKPICKEYLDDAVPDRGRENSTVDVTKHHPPYQKIAKNLDSAHSTLPTALF